MNRNINGLKSRVLRRGNKGLESVGKKVRDSEKGLMKLVTFRFEQGSGVPQLCFRNVAWVVVCGLHYRGKTKFR